MLNICLVLRRTRIGRTKRMMVKLVVYFLISWSREKQSAMSQNHIEHALAQSRCKENEHVVEKQ